MSARDVFFVQSQSEQGTVAGPDNVAVWVESDLVAVPANLSFERRDKWVGLSLISSPDSLPRFRS